jgi:hypothetical protein
MFEVGKQYQGRITGRVIEILHVGEEKAFVRTVIAVKELPYRIGGEHTIDNDLFGDNWKPYVPPVVHTEECFVKLNALSGFRIDDEASCFHETPGTVLVGKLRLTHTEGVGLTVDVLE